MVGFWSLWVAGGTIDEPVDADVTVAVGLGVLVVKDPIFLMFDVAARVAAFGDGDN